MAKGVEDTAFYRWLRLSSLNEVGGDPSRLGVPVEELHDWCTRQLATWPDAMTTLSTHDTKRSEDVRARLAALSEVPEEWSGAVTRWRAMTSSLRPAELDSNTEYLMWQTLVGTWPIDGPRLTAYLEKATREAKRRTTWTEPDEAYDAAVAGFAEAVLAAPEVVSEVETFIARLAPAWRANVLAQKLLALMVPGVPDVYQGADLTDLSLVDPDNRRAVDYTDRVARLGRLDAGEPPRDLDDEKLVVVSRALRLRREHSEWFGADSTYQPLECGSGQAVAFARGPSAGGAEVVIVVSRLAALSTASARRAEGEPSLLELPAMPTSPTSAGAWRDVLTGATFTGPVEVAGVLATFPVALLVRAE